VATLGENGVPIAALIFGLSLVFIIKHVRDLQSITNDNTSPVI
jgi:hypothetical protein